MVLKLEDNLKGFLEWLDFQKKVNLELKWGKNYMKKDYNKIKNIKKNITRNIEKKMKNLLILTEEIFVICDTNITKRLYYF